MTAIPSEVEPPEVEDEAAQAELARVCQEERLARLRWGVPGYGGSSGRGLDAGPYDNPNHH